jgi:exopolysaccharide/PEP-CTERM locus tyrosine autokinase
MSLIEKAAQRLEQLRRAGIAEPMSAPPTSEAAAVSEKPPTPEAAVRQLAHVSVAELPVETVRRAAPKTETAARPVFEFDFAYLAAQGYLTPDAARSQLSDEMRVIKRPLMRNAVGPPGARVKNGNLIMVTSALPKEGKTFTSINLVMSLATELDTTVLLVDGDVAHPGLPRVLRIPQSPGLLDLLTTPELDVGDALLRTNVPNLTILPAGSMHRRATELLASDQMTALLRDLSARYPDRIIVFDSPPLLAATEARVLATHMGQVLMVVAADSTLQSDVNLALSTIESCEVVHMMLNKAARTDVGAYYGYFADDAPSP